MFPVLIGRSSKHAMLIAPVVAYFLVCCRRREQDDCRTMPVPAWHTIKRAEAMKEGHVTLLDECYTPDKVGPWTFKALWLR
jgi:hypothetical protein